MNKSVTFENANYGEGSIKTMAVDASEFSPAIKFNVLESKKLQFIMAGESIVLSADIARTLAGFLRAHCFDIPTPLGELIDRELSR